MSTNVSKKKREDLLSKIGQIRTFIASAPQDTNTGNLLSYLSELEKDINGHTSKIILTIILCISISPQQNLIHYFNNCIVLNFPYFFSNFCEFFSSFLYFLMIKLTWIRF